MISQHSDVRRTSEEEDSTGLIMRPSDSTNLNSSFLYQLTLQEFSRCDFARKTVHRVRCSQRYLIRSLPKDRLDTRRRMQPVPLFILIMNVEFADCHRQGDLDIQHRKRLANAVPWASFEWPPSTFWRVQRMARLNKPALRQELMRLRPVFWIPLYCSV
jgi:hypothetical protein